jgi:hypothetical protein
LAATQNFNNGHAELRSVLSRTPPGSTELGR